MNARGFTLLELVVALGLFAVLSTLAYGGLRATLFSQGVLEAESRQWTELQLAVARLDRDLRYVAERTIRDENGEPQPALSGATRWLEFTRAGWANPAAQPRASLQRVRWQWERDALQRLAWPVLDRSSDSGADVAAVIERLDRIEFRYLRDDQWIDAWPPPDGNQAANGALPRAVSVRLEHPALGRIERLYTLPGGERP